MLRTIWFMWKPGEERTYAMTVQPNATWAAIQRRDGFHIVSFDVDIPDPTVEAKLGTVKPPFTGIVHAAAHAREVAKANPGCVVPVMGSLNSLVAVCDNLCLHQNGAIVLNDELISYMTSKSYPRYSIKPGYAAIANRLSFQSLVSWWYANCRKFSEESDLSDRVHIADQVASNVAGDDGTSSDQPYPSPPGTIST